MFKLVVLVSGGGTNLQAIIDAIKSGKLLAKIDLVVADRECYGLERAKSANIPTKLIDRKIYKDKLSEELTQSISSDCDLVVMAGFLSIIKQDFVRKFENKIINLHPSLLPKFGGIGMWGMNVHKAVINAREKFSGCTVHYVTEEVDGGNIIEQAVVEILPTETYESLQKKIAVEEHKLIVSVIDRLSRGI